LELATNEGDLVLDSFAGSGTTAAVAHKMNRKWITVELGQHAITHCFPRFQRIIDRQIQQELQKRLTGKAVAVSNSTPLHQAY